MSHRPSLVGDARWTPTSDTPWSSEEDVGRGQASLVGSSIAAAINLDEGVAGAGAPDEPQLAVIMLAGRGAPLLRHGTTLTKSST